MLCKETTLLDIVEDYIIPQFISNIDSKWGNRVVKSLEGKFIEKHISRSCCNQTIVNCLQVILLLE
jgi:hypothetical protein